MLEAPGSIALALRLRDKFGDQGIVALLLAIPAGDNATLSIDTFLVSCRALGPWSGRCSLGSGGESGAPTRCSEGRSGISCHGEEWDRGGFLR